MLTRRFLGNVLLPISWTILIQVLLCLPGSSIPHEGVFSVPDLDKVAHFVLYVGFVGFWCFYFFLKKEKGDTLKKIFFIVFLIAIANGIMMEYVQRYFIPSRSFDEADIIADMLGASISYGICNVKLLKTI